MYVGDVFIMPLGSKYADLQQKITSDTSCGKLQTFHCSNFTTMKSFPKNNNNKYSNSEQIAMAHVLRVPNVLKKVALLLVTALLVLESVAFSP